MQQLNAKIIIGLFVLAIVFGASLSFATTPPYTGGWEVETNIDNLYVNQNTYTLTEQPLNTYSFGTAYAKFDVDDENMGVPTVSVQLYAPIEYINVDGEWLKARPGETFKKITKEVGNDIYFFYHHVFFFDVQIIAEAEWISSGGIKGEAKGMLTAIEAQISVTMLFDANIWSVLSSVTSDNGTATYINSGVWTGVMSASVLEASGGYVSALPDGFAGVPGAWSVTNVGRLNMFRVEGSETDDTTLDELRANPSLIEGVPSKILLEIGGTTLQPAWWWPPLGSIGTYAVEARYRVRADVVTSAKYTFEQGDQDDTANNASVEDDEGKGILYEFAAWVDSVLGSPTALIWMVISIIVVFGVLFIGMKLVVGVYGRR